MIALELTQSEKEDLVSVLKMALEDWEENDRGTSYWTKENEAYYRRVVQVLKKVDEAV